MTINYGFDEIDGTNECPDKPTTAYGDEEWHLLADVVEEDDTHLMTYSLSISEE